MTEIKSNFSPDLAKQKSNNGFDKKSRIELALFFRDRRVAAGLNHETVALALGYDSITTLVAYESGSEAIPLDDIFALTNLLNIPPEDVLGLVYDMAHDLNSPQGT